MPPVPKPKRQRQKHYFREWREKNDLTQEQAIGRLGWSQSKISRLESGKIPYSQDDLEAAAEAYGASSPSDLLTINPLKDGEVIDLMRLLNKAENREMAIRVLKSMAGD